MSGGLFAEADLPLARGRPPIALWTPPVGALPRIRGARVAIDTETKDGGFDKGRGPGWVYRDGYILGVSVAWRPPGHRGAPLSIYVPVKHPDTENRDIRDVIEWIEDIIRHNDIVMFNTVYDMGWLRIEGLSCWPQRRLDDPSVMARMIDENWDEYSLDAICSRAGILGKDETLLTEAFLAYGAVKKNGSYKHAIWRLPARFVGPYAEQDAVATLELCARLEPEMDRQKLGTAYDTEMRLIPCIHDMRKRGIRINTDKAEQAQARVRLQRDAVLSQMRAPSGRVCTIEDLRSPATLAKMFQAVGVDFPYTKPTPQHKDGLPSFKKAWLEKEPHPLAAQVRLGRQMEDLAEKFIGNYILEFEHLGRIHAEIHPLKSDAGGTVTTRISYSAPPLQQMPARGDTIEQLEIIQAIRAVFEAERGQFWFAPDYSQQEPRIAVHISGALKLRGSEEAIRYYRDKGKDADFHTMVADLASIPRPRAKIINLGLMFGMGLKKLAASLGFSEDEAKDLMALYHKKVPWVKLLQEEAEKLAQTKGYVKMLDGARRHFPFYEQRWKKEEGGFIRGLEAARDKWSDAQVQRAFCRDAMNSAVQGSAARQTKIAMVRSYEAGLLPLIQMHDELGFSFDDPKHGEQVTDIMVSAIPLLVPVKVDADWGKDWGHAKYTYEEVRAQ